MKKEILKKWSSLGFLDGLEEPKISNVANAFELTAQKLISEESYRYRIIEQISFPILRLIFQTVEIEINSDSIEENVLKILDKLSIEYKEYIENPIAKEVDEEYYIDTEAEFCRAFSDIYKLEL